MTCNWNTIIVQLKLMKHYHQSLFPTRIKFYHVDLRAKEASRLLVVDWNRFILGFLLFLPWTRGSGREIDSWNVCQYHSEDWRSRAFSFWLTREIGFDGPAGLADWFGWSCWFKSWNLTLWHCLILFLKIRIVNNIMLLSSPWDQSTLRKIE